MTDDHREDRSAAAPGTPSAAAPDAPAADLPAPAEAETAPVPAVPETAPAPAEAETAPVPAVPETAPVPADAGAIAEAPAPAPAAADLRKPARRRRIVAVAGCLLLAAAVAGGVGYTGVVVDGADRDAGAPVWASPKAAADEEEAEATGLAATLVPYRSDGWTRGPDLGEFGSDTVLSGAQATALRKESLRGLPRSERRRLEKEIDRRPVAGMAMRSYVHTPAFDEGEKGSVTTGIVLAQMESRAAVRDMSTVQNDFFASLDIFREGPRIKGHTNARCFLPPADSDEDLDLMFCSAYQGDVLVTLTAEGVKPFDSDGVAALLTEQLDRIAEPGEAV
ncbi:hypothetical protein [Streptomyces sp. NPDC090994]|uniref:hypothetical protein n=1 Tax=Streptomyces sp. NPDC090994 TaxID=3365969 RepID=UPI0038190CB4